MTRLSRRGTIQTRVSVGGRATTAAAAATASSAASVSVSASVLLLRTSSRRVIRGTMFVLLAMAALVSDYGYSDIHYFAGVAAFHQSPNMNHPNGRRRHPQQQPQQQHQQQPQQQQQPDNQHTNANNYPPRPRTVEQPQTQPDRNHDHDHNRQTTTEFPRTPSDRRSNMFSPRKVSRSNGDYGSSSPNGDSGSSSKANPRTVKSIWETSAPVLVEASSLRTFDFERPSVERVQVLLKKAEMVDPVHGGKRRAGEPLIARVDLWHGPDSTPQNLAIYLEEEEDEDYYNDNDNGEDYGVPNHHDPFGSSRGSSSSATAKIDTPFSTIIETPQGHNTIAIRNIAESSDLLACVEGEENQHERNSYENGWYTPSAAPGSTHTQTQTQTTETSPLQSVIQRLKATTTPQRIDSTTARPDETANNGQDVDNDEEDDDNKPVIGSCAVELPSNIASVQVLLQTQFMQPLQARIELELRATEPEHKNKNSNNNNSNNKYRVVKRTIVEVYSEDGMDRPFFAVLEAPRKSNPAEWFGGGGSSSSNSNSNKASSYCTSMRVVNLSTTEFPLFATVEPHAVDPSRTDDEEDDRAPGGSNANASANANASVREDSNDNDDDDDDSEDFEDDSQEWTHFGGGSNYDMISNSTILDAEIL